LGRPAKFSEDQVLDAALAVIAENGPGAATIGAIAARLGAPSGSIYHRFGSRDLLLATLWTRCAHRFQQGFIAALASDDAESAALHTPRWCRSHLDEAAVLLLYRRQDLVAEWPAEFASVNREADAALDAFIERHPDLDRERLLFATVDVPYGAVRRHLLNGTPPPSTIDPWITTTCRTVLTP
jgi:AcrR family transcriptional regulator